MKKIRSPKDARHISPNDRPCFFSRGKFDFSSRDFHEERYDEGEGHSSQMFALLRMEHRLTGEPCVRSFVV